MTKEPLVSIICDEIHNDIFFKGNKHHVLANLGEKYRENTITCVVPSKTFNLAGLQYSLIIIPSKELRRQFNRVLGQLSLGLPNPFAIVATTAAYNEAEYWLEELNLKFLEPLCMRNYQRSNL